MATKFYETRDHILARERDGHAPELYGPESTNWRLYPALDPYHDARVITRKEALELLPEGSPDGELDKPGSEKSPPAPVRSA